MNEAIQLLENQGDPLSSALALKYALAPAFRLSIALTLLLQTLMHHL
jgi:hypothetical protein